MEVNNQPDACCDCGCSGAYFCTGNKQWAQSETSNKKAKPTSNKPEETLEIKPSGWQMNCDTGVYMMEVKDGRIGIALAGEKVGEIWIEGKTMRFKGNVDDSAAVLLIALKRYIYIDNWLKMKDK